MAARTLPPDDRRAVNITEAARLSGVSRYTIANAIKAKKLVAHYPTSRPVIRLDDLDRWLAACPTQVDR